MIANRPLEKKKQRHLSVAFLLEPWLLDLKIKINISKGFL